MSLMASQITSLTIVYSTVYSDADQRKHQSSATLAFVRGIHRGPVNSPHKWQVTRKMFPFDDVIMSKMSQREKSLNKVKKTLQAPYVTYIDDFSKDHVGCLKQIHINRCHILRWDFKYSRYYHTLTFLPNSVFPNDEICGFCNEC